MQWGTIRQVLMWIMWTKTLFFGSCSGCSCFFGGAGLLCGQIRHQTRWSLRCGYLHRLFIVYTGAWAYCSTLFITRRNLDDI
ncbi:hypothetical protein COCSADRAFT_244747 [Bipolaris sorokiniana ND90Pr]|uniref:Uncharacterized protein n=1 Tax=Cochliobolus sativus (strain ND90Pr / ATCC 201652) TaxID=665912 RepID=M2S021_COCSN|nr:uncharacterized protein COCSADRAFT_244747 [Bipolaris sorokiniana ND90Pr]EMD60603.1 hypothetical protein COCSADRAFT_244747 [Bipolaris sorokiniana ND90Pr]